MLHFCHPLKKWRSVGIISNPINCQSGSFGPNCQTFDCLPLQEAARKLEKKTTKKDPTSKKSGKPNMDSTIVMEQVKKDTQTLTKAEQMELLMRYITSGL